MMLITGGMGFIGLHTARRFVDVGEEVVIGYHRSQRAPSFLKDAWEKHVFAEPLDVTDLSDWLAIGRKYPITGIVHMAVPGVGANAVALSKEFKTDTQGLLHALEMAQQWQVQRLSLASSQAVYRGIMAGPFREDTPLPVDSLSGTEVYKKWTSRACNRTSGTSRSGRWTALSLTTSRGCATTQSSRQGPRSGSGKRSGTTRPSLSQR
jgi:UDP-glucose 4-epimerase